MRPSAGVCVGRVLVIQRGGVGGRGGWRVGRRGGKKEKEDLVLE